MAAVYAAPAVVTVTTASRPARRIRAMVTRVAPEGETRQVWRIEKRGPYDGWLCDEHEVALVD